MHKPESVLENEICKILWDFERNKSPNPDQNRKPSDELKKNMKRTCSKVGFIVPADHSMKNKENELKDENLDFARELRKLWNNGDINCDWHTGNGPQRLGSPVGWVVEYRQ